MKKIIITESQLLTLKNFILENSTNSTFTQSIINKFDDFKNTFTKQIENANKLVNMEKLINIMMNYTLNNIPNVIDNKIDVNQYLNEYYDFLIKNFENELDNLGWGKKKIIKTILGDKDKAIPTMDEWKFKDVIWNILFLGNIPEGINQKWSDSYDNLVIKNKIPFYQKIRNLLIDKLYS